MNHRIFITGGASGLGREIAIRFARAGWRICIADIHDARGEETLPALIGAKASAYLHCDVTREEDLIAAAHYLQESWGGVDVVVNNAGVAQAGRIEEVTIEDWRWIFDINVLGVVRGCRVFTPVFKRQGRGHFVNIASMAGLLDVPLMSSYNASKAAIVSLSETLQNELMDHNIRVTLVCPSFFKTNLHESMRTPDPGLRIAMNKLLSRSEITAEHIAEHVYRAVDRGQFYVLPHSEGRSAWLLKRFLPRRLYASLIRRQTRRSHLRRSAQSAEGKRP